MGPGWLGEVWWDVVQTIPRERLERVEMIVVDEADMQLAGALADEVLENVLRATRAGGPMKGRPQHVLVGATLPDSGLRSVRRAVEHLYKCVGEDGWWWLCCLC
jgi:superfamily II DNA/RNA helicase